MQKIGNDAIADILFIGIIIILILVIGTFYSFSIGLNFFNEGKLFEGLFMFLIGIILLIFVFAVIFPGSHVIVIEIIGNFANILKTFPEMIPIIIAIVFGLFGMYYINHEQIETSKYCVSIAFAAGGWGEVPMQRIPPFGKAITALIGTIGPILTLATDWIV